MRLCIIVVLSLLVFCSCGDNKDLSFEIPNSCKDFCNYKKATAGFKEVVFSEHSCLLDCLVNFEEASFCGCVTQREKYNNCMVDEIAENYKIAAVWFGFPSSELDQSNYSEVAEYCEYDHDDYEDCLTDCSQ